MFYFRKREIVKVHSSNLDWGRLDFNNKSKISKRYVLASLKLIFFPKTIPVSDKTIEFLITT